MVILWKVSPNNQGVVSGGAMMLGKLPVSGRPTYLGNSTPDS